MVEIDVELGGTDLGDPRPSIPIDVDCLPGVARVPHRERVRASARDQMLKLLTGPVESDYDALRAESDRVARELGAR